MRPNLTNQFIKCGGGYFPASTTDAGYLNECDEPGLFLKCQGTKEGSLVWLLRLRGREGIFIDKQLGLKTQVTFEEAKIQARALRHAHYKPDSVAWMLECEPVLSSSLPMKWDSYMQIYLADERHRARSKSAKNLYVQYISPTFGDTPISNTTKRDAQVFNNLLVLESGLTAGKAKRVIDVMVHALKVATRWNWIDENPLVGLNQSVIIEQCYSAYN